MSNASDSSPPSDEEWAAASSPAHDPTTEKPGGNIPVMEAPDESAPTMADLRQAGIEAHLHRMRHDLDELRNKLLRPAAPFITSILLTLGAIFVHFHRRNW